MTYAAITIADVARDPAGGWTLVTLSCGHVSRRNQIYTYKLGERTTCSMCDQHAEALKVDRNPEKWPHIIGRAS